MAASRFLFLGKREQSYGKQYKRNASMVLALRQVQRQEILNDLALNRNRVKWVQRERGLLKSVHRQISTMGIAGF
jgi:hypothetical protein